MIASVKNLRKLCNIHGWKTLDVDKQHGLVRITKDKCYMDIHYLTCIVATTLKHPTRGKNTLYRRGVNYALLSKILKNPRVHTTKGYHVGNISGILCPQCLRGICDCPAGDEHYICDHDIWAHTILAQ